MKQQVNLYQPIFRRQKKVLSGLAMVQVVLLVAAGLGLIYVHAAWRLHTLKGDIVVLDAQRNAARARLEDTQRRMPPRQASRLLQAQVTAQATDLARRQRVVAMLGGWQAPGRRGFSSLLEALSREHIPDTWITDFRVSDGGQVLEIHGSALRPELIPRYVERLGRETAFREIRFQGLEMSRVSERQVDFVLRTALDDAEDRS